MRRLKKEKKLAMYMYGSTTRVNNWLRMPLIPIYTAGCLYSLKYLRIA